MAALVIAAAGSAIGGALIPAGILGVSGASIGYFAGSLLASALIKGPNSQGPRLGDLRVQGTEYGAPFPWVAGAPRLAGQIVWASNRREIANTQKVGKGGGSKVTTFTYEVDLLIVLTENVTSGVAREWLNGELVYNGVPKAGLWNSFTVYTGEPTQLPDPVYEAAVGVGNAPAYRGRTSILIQGLQLGNSGQIGNLTSEIGLSGADPLRPTGFLNQFNSVSGGSAPSEIGEPVDTLALPTLTVDPAGRFGNAVTGYGRSGVIPLDVAGAFWRFEGWWKSPTEGGGTAEQFATLECDGGTFVTLNYSLAPFLFTVNFALEGVVGGGAYGSSGNRPVSETWVHWAWQQNPTTGTLAFFLNGRCQFVMPGTLSGSSIRYRFNQEGTNYASVDSTVLYSYPNASEFYPDTPGDLYSIPGSPFELRLADRALGWFETPLDPDGLMNAAQALLLRAGYEPDEFDVSALAGQPLHALATSGVGNTRGIFETLQTAFFFEAAKSDRVYLRPRALAPVVLIPFDDIGTAADPASSEEPLALTVGNELEIPAQVSVSYNNMSADYNVGTEHSDRLISGQETNQVVQLAVGMLPAKAKGVADALLIDQLASLTRTTIRLPLKYARLEPGDVIEVVNQDGRVYRLRIGTKRDTLTLIELECTADDVGALTSAQVTSGDYALTETVRQLAPTIWQALDIPILRDADNAPGFYFALAPNRATPEDQWDGAAAVRSWSGDAFEQLFLSGDACAMGACTTTLGNFAGGSGRFDEASTLTVRVTGELANTTRADMLDDLGINAALVGSEIIRFRSAELLGTVDGENEYRLTSLLRGQRGTEQHIATHGATERFVLLNASLRRVVNLTSEIGVASEVKAVTLNTLLSSVASETFTDTGVGLKPFSVASLRCLPAGADLALSWNRRTRLGYRYGGTVGVSVPLGEASELYRIDVLDGATLVATYTATDGAYTYTAAQIAADGFVSSDQITFTVRQVSELVGPGFPATIESAAP